MKTTLLKDTKPYTWHRLQTHPDKIHPTGPTSFFASWHPDDRRKIDPPGVAVRTRNDMKSASWNVTDTGSGRLRKYLNTPVVTDQDTEEAVDADGLH